MAASQITGLGAVRLRVSNLERSVAAYSGVMGFHVEQTEDGGASFSAGKGMPSLIVVHEAAGAQMRPPGTTGLFHFALCFPDRPSLADMLSRLVTRGYPLQGAAHHGVSEALYLADPDGNGIEFYRDLPRALWPESDRGVDMVTQPLDLRSLLREKRVLQEGSAAVNSVPEVGHIHLQVSDLARAEEYYCTILGFDVRQRNFPGALFVAANGYHHHIGLNVWEGEGAPQPPPGSLGLEAFDIRCSSDDAVDIRMKALRGHGFRAESAFTNGARVLVTSDPDGNVVRLVSGETS